MSPNAILFQIDELVRWKAQTFDNGFVITMQARVISTGLKKCIIQLSAGQQKVVRTCDLLSAPALETNG